MRSDTLGSQPHFSSVVQPAVAGHQYQQGSIAHESREAKAALASIEVDANVVSSLGKELVEEINKYAD